MTGKGRRAASRHATGGEYARAGFSHLSEKAPSHPGSEGVTLALRFVADVMLGGLAKWLRAMGFDTLYFHDIEDSELARLARLEQRVLLTRDTAMARERRLPQHILVRANETRGQVVEVLRALMTADTFALSVEPRCMRCNGELVPAERASVMNEIPEHVFLNTASFSRCSDCGRVYWEGSHKRTMDRMISSMVEEAAEKWKG